MPTYEKVERFDKDYARLSPTERKAFRRAVQKFVEDLELGDGCRKGLRVKGVQGSEGVFEMTWADNGRATFSYGESIHDGQPHIIWRRVGTHDILG